MLVCCHHTHDIDHIDRVGRVVVVVLGFTLPSNVVALQHIPHHVFHQLCIVGGSCVYHAATLGTSRVEGGLSVLWVQCFSDLVCITPQLALALQPPCTHTRCPTWGSPHRSCSAGVRASASSAAFAEASAVCSLIMASLVSIACLFASSA